MKNDAKKVLIKDIIIALVAWLVFGLLCSTVGGLGIGGFFLGLFFAGIPFGWRWLSNIIVATSIITVGLKAFASIFVGWIALFVVIIKDIIVYVKAEE